MTRGVFALVVLGLVVASVSRAAVTAQLRSDKNSVSDGVYTEEQAKRGEAVYVQECVTCHGRALEGIDVAPALAGAFFTTNWKDLTVGDLAERIRLSMPAGSPGKLSRPQSADLIAYLLKVNGWPAGDVELGSDLVAMKAIKIVVNAP